MKKVFFAFVSLLFCLNTQAQCHFTNCVPTIVFAVLNTQCKITIPNFTNTALTGGCTTPVVVTQSPLANTQFPAINGQLFTVTLTATDANGATATCTRTIRADDKTKPPIHTCPPSQTVILDANGMLIVPDKTGQLVSTDGCSNPVTKTQNPIAGSLISCLPGGQIITIFTVTDGAGNTRTCTAILTGQ